MTGQTGTKQQSDVMSEALHNAACHSNPSKGAHCRKKKEQKNKTIATHRHHCRTKKWDSVTLLIICLVSPTLLAESNALREMLRARWVVSNRQFEDTLAYGDASPFPGPSHTGWTEHRTKPIKGCVLAVLAILLSVVWDGNTVYCNIRAVSVFVNETVQKKTVGVLWTARLECSELRRQRKPTRKSVCNGGIAKCQVKLGDEWARWWWFCPWKINQIIISSVVVVEYSTNPVNSVLFQTSIQQEDKSLK